MNLSIFSYEIMCGKKIKVGCNEVAIIYFHVNYWKGGLKCNWADNKIKIIYLKDNKIKIIYTNDNKMKIICIKDNKMKIVCIKDNEFKIIHKKFNKIKIM